MPKNSKKVGFSRILLQIFTFFLSLVVWKEIVEILIKIHEILIFENVFAMLSMKEVFSSDFTAPSPTTHHRYLTPLSLTFHFNRKIRETVRFHWCHLQDCWWADHKSPTIPQVRRRWDRRSPNHDFSASLDHSGVHYRLIKPPKKWNKYHWISTWTNWNHRAAHRHHH